MKLLEVCFPYIDKFVYAVSEICLFIPNLRRPNTDVFVGSKN